MEELTKETTPNRGEKGKEQEFTGILRTKLIKFEGIENEIVENANLRMQNSKAYRIWAEIMADMILEVENSATTIRINTANWCHEKWGDINEKF